MSFNNFYSKGIYASLLASSLLIFSCSDDDDNNSTTGGPDDDIVMMEDPIAIEEGPIWSYDESAGNGPSVWGELDSEFIACAEGLEQSPINLVSDTVLLQGATIGEGDNAVTIPTGELVFDYSTEAMLQALNNTRTNEFVVAEGSGSVTFNGTVFNLAQFHGHAASEHTLEGVQSPLELHFVHVSDDDELLVVGVLINEGAENLDYASFWTDENLIGTPEGVEVRQDVEGTHDLSALLPIGQTLYQFAGSLTTPPCSEGVNWNVFTESIEMSAEQIGYFTRNFDNNYRPIQELNDRTVSESVETANIPQEEETVSIAE